MEEEDANLNTEERQGEDEARYESVEQEIFDDATREKKKGKVTKRHDTPMRKKKNRLGFLDQSGDKSGPVEEESNYEKKRPIMRGEERRKMTRRTNDGGPSRLDRTANQTEERHRGRTRKRVE
jgi:hypothetical protein